MLLIAIVYAYWFFQSAKRRNRPQPALWAAAGFAAFYVPAFFAMWGISAINPVMMIANPYDTTGYYDNPEFLIPLIVDSVSAILIANFFALVLWSAHLRPAPWHFKSAVQNAAQRRTFALPGPFPWFFALVFPALVMIAAVIATALNPPAPPGMGLPTLDSLNWKLVNALLQTAGFTFILWRVRPWAAIAVSWAAVMAGITLISYTFLMSHLGTFVPNLMVGVAVKFVIFLVFYGIVAYSVRRWGAGLKILLLSTLAGQVLVNVPFLLIEGVIQLFIIAALWSLMQILALYVSFLFYEEKR